MRFGASITIRRLGWNHTPRIQESLKAMRESHVTKNRLIPSRLFLTTDSAPTGSPFSSGTSSPSRSDVDQANQQYRDKIIIKTTASKGWGVFALQDFQPGDLVISAKSMQTCSEPNSHTIQVDWNQHVLMNLPALLLNHVCNSANLVARRNSHGAYDFYAHRNVAAKDELTFDYETTEYALQAEFECHCGDSKCRRQLKGFAYHGSDVLQVFGPENVAPYLRNALNDSEDAALHG